MPGCLCRARSVRADVSCLRGVREVVETGGDVLLGAGRAGMRVRARMLAQRSARRWGEARESSPVA